LIGFIGLAERLLGKRRIGFRRKRSKLAPLRGMASWQVRAALAGREFVSRRSETPVGTKEKQIGKLLKICEHAEVDARPSIEHKTLDGWGTVS
jgi:hypothetical protein